MFNDIPLKWKTALSIKKSYELNDQYNIYSREIWSSVE